jgi:hypothetical protein
MENISTIQLSLFLRTSLMMISLAVISLVMISIMTSLRTVLKRHDRKIGKKNSYDDQNPNPFWEHFPLFPFWKEEELSIDMINL